MTPELKHLVFDWTSGRLGFEKFKHAVLHLQCRSELSPLGEDPDLKAFVESSLSDGSQGAALWDALAAVTLYGVDSPKIREGIGRQIGVIHPETARLSLDAAHATGDATLIAQAHRFGLDMVRSGRGVRRLEHGWAHKFAQVVDDAERIELAQMIAAWHSYSFDRSRDREKEYYRAELIYSAACDAALILGQSIEDLQSVVRRWTEAFA